MKPIIYILLFSFSATITTGVASASYPWSDPDHPELDYSHPFYRMAYEDGAEIAGWWIIEENHDELDDSPLAKI